MVKRLAPGKYFVFHDSFRPAYANWKDLFEEGDTELTAVDHHAYLAWDFIPTVGQACNTQLLRNYAYSDDFRSNGIEVWIGEWSLATDTCAHWLMGFNDGRNGTGINATCKAVECPKSYLPADEFDTSFDRNSSEPLGPTSYYNASLVGITNGMCWDDAEYYNPS